MIITIGGKCCLNAFMRCLPKHLLALALALTVLAPRAQSAEESFRGSWQVQTPEQGSLIILLKNQGIASYFWGDNADRTVYQGSWTHAETIATASWKDGSSHLFERTASGLTVSYRTASGDRAYTAPAQQIPQEVLGQWAKPPTREDDMRSARDEAEGFFGIWKLAGSEDFIFVESDRATASNIGGAPGQRGQWAKQGSELHIIWDSGRYGILRETERGYDYKQVESGEVIEDDETAPVAAARTIEANVPSTWMAAYRTEREADSDGLAFSSRRTARDFYRGDWLVRRGENTFERIEMARFGGLETSRDRSLSGQWTLSGQDSFLRWDDGMRQVLSPVGRGFILYAYRPGRPLDGVPTRIYAAAPAESAKLAQHLEGRKDVAQQLREMAEAAGIDPASQEDVGWGRTFARWAWPFSDSSDGMTSEQMLEEEFEPETSSDPWWWPFWTEQPRPEKENPRNKNGDALENSTGIETISKDITKTPAELTQSEATAQNQDATPESEAADQEAASPAASTKRRSTKSWLWPF